MTGAIVGRDAELAAIAGFLDGEAWPRTLLIAGEAGMGKTTLWRAGAERAEAEGRALLAARPLETETKLAYAGVGDLLASSHDAFEELPPPQAQALRAALLLEASAGASIDERAVSLGFLGVLRVLAQARPVARRRRRSPVARPRVHTRFSSSPPAGCPSASASCLRCARRRVVGFRSRPSRCSPATPSSDLDRSAWRT